jgi:ATP-dependent Clp protease ATP-binding subunit ClpB
MLKVAMDEETITILGATTSEQYAEHIVPHQVSDHRLVDIAIDEPSIEQTQKMLSESVCRELDEKRGVKMLDSSLRLAVELASKYMKSSRPFSADWLVEEAYSAAARRARAIEDAKARMRYELEGVRINMRTFESPRNARDPQIETLIRETKAREQQAKAELRRLEHAETQVARDKVERDKLDHQLSKLTQELVRPEIVANLTERQRVISLLADVTGRRNEVNDRLQVYVTEDDVKEGLERITKIRLRAATPEEYQQAAEIGPKLRQVIFGQDKAIDAISKCFLRRLDDPSCQRPIGALLFTGPCGTGKTALGEDVAEHVFGSKRGRLLQISAGSFRGPTARADFLGGQHTRGTLASFVSGAGTGVILVDFVDRGDFHLYELCAEMLQKGSITNEETGVTLNLSKFLFIFTGITGAEYIRHRVVFRGYDGHDGPTATDEEKVHVAVRAHFGSNFLKVLDEVVVFEPLVGPAAVSLLEKDLADIKGDYERLQFQLAFTDRAIEWLTVKRQLLDGRVAARALRNGVQSLLLKAYGYSILALRGQSGIVDWWEDGVLGASIQAGEGALVMRDRV